MSLSATARFRYAMAGGATAVVIGVAFTATGLHQRSSGADPSPGAVSAPLQLLATPSPAGVSPLDAIDAPTPSPSSVVPTSAPASTAPARRTTAPVPTTKPPKKPSGGGGGSSLPGTSQNVLDAVLAHINAARSAAGLSAYTLDTKLSRASALHNQKMINGCGLSHQCAGEDSIGPRFSAQGVAWTSAAENIGYGSSGSGDDALISAANGLTDSMLAEKPPDDGHRKNLLNSGLKKIGLSVVRDAKGLTWMTQDFVN